ncbi:alpha/beta hydrolase [Sphingomonas radiodurans]|uniref:alpha/beta hydrolase n=1 Tax=Sphingomonas radiodurans TaxID=2890321 RepID=UPI001E3F9A1D|nr:alpha/beta hydrolase [Sphingomonas radiodurans]WBH16001.1 alpha/beta hydrolase [Sphingomonas radiodurans]
MTDTLIRDTETAAKPAPFVRPDVRGFLDYLNAVPGPKTHEGTAEAARAMYIAMKDIADPPVGTLGTVKDLVIPGPAGDIPARLFDPRETREPSPVVVFFHGGGFVIGNIDTHASFTAEMARQLDLPVVSIDYRLAPEAPWPAAPEDCEAAARWVASSPAELGRTATSLVLSGDSAGGTLTITTAMALRDDAAAVPVIVQAPIYPAADMNKEYPSFDDFADGFLLTRETMNWFADHYRADFTHFRGSPMVGALTGLPPAVVITASLDPIRDQGRAYAAALVLAGVPVTYREAVGNIHGFITLRQAVPSGAGDVAGYLAAVKDAIVEAEGQRVMVQAAG